ncbi:MAG: 30S ribosomal protein S17 [Candidatus Peribacteraceae bacterium]|nr:30S ribosomal protein S17 [Candidatus Peribacteraceae bacterium]
MRTKKGIVTSAKMTGTVSVTVHASVMHPVYKKRFRRSKKFLADTNGHDVHAGDIVIITECRPLSKNKRFKVTEIAVHAPRVDDVVEEATVEKAIHREKHAPVIEKKEEKNKKEKTAEKTKEKSSDSLPSSPPQS